MIPAYNEERRIGATLESLCAVAQDLKIGEIIVVDDGSEDRTADIVHGFGPACGATALRLLIHEHNTGKGAALRTGLLASCGSLAGYLDADLSVSPRTFTEAKSLLAAGADIVIGIRVDTNGLHSRPSQPFLRRSLGRGFIQVQRAVVGLKFQDTQCPFKVFTRAAVDAIIPRCRVNGWAFDVELLRVATRQELRVVEMPVHWSHIAGSSLKASPATALRTVRELLAIRWADNKV